MIINNNVIYKPKLECDKNQENWNSELLYDINKKIEDAESELFECHKECESTELEIYDVNQLKDKGKFVLKNIEGRYNNVNDELKEIHFNYEKCLEKVHSNKENVQQNINFLTMQRRYLRKELEELKKIADKNKEKLMEVQKMITIQEVSYVKFILFEHNPLSIYKTSFLEKKYGRGAKIEKNGGKNAYNARFRRQGKQNPK
ncbi:hypothetical protein WH47_08727 [Habropoda laboriosa]|uniref:Uncharacterized protein n=1 Tax=Habropoda laboriosa TaxID=597456 RepID=A0A0L7QP36_9HYME|nr:hypothetical protein WH47_08727 [Habropoda laboriosa]